MQKWFPDVTTVDGAAAGAKSGLIAALAVVAIYSIGLYLILTTGGLPGNPTSPSDAVPALVSLVIEIAVGLGTVWRFRQRKGLVIGTIFTSMFALEVAFRLSAGMVGPGWLILYAAIAIGLVNGIRAAWAVRKFDRADIAALQHDFQ